MPDLLDRLQIVENRYEEISGAISDPGVMADQERYRTLLKEHASLQPIVDAITSYRKMLDDMKENRSLFAQTGDRELRELAREEIEMLESRIAESEDDLIERLAPRDPRDDRDVIIEIRAGAGGEEASLFVAVLFRMYSMYADRSGWKTETVNVNETELGGFREIVFNVKGQGAFSRLKYESGVHRVQRVPVTESGGRTHTSTVTVAVLAEVDPVEVEIDPNDLDIDTFRASGAGGQHINKTDSAIRITHRPSGIVVSCQDQRSQHKNRDQAMAILRARLFDSEERKRHSEIANDRKSQVGTGDRSERIRTYNYSQGRVSDHRVGLTLYRLDAILNGDMDEIFRTLIAADRAAALGDPAGDEKT